jgi:hypothetical protein
MSAAKTKEIRTMTERKSNAGSRVRGRMRPALLTAFIALGALLAAAGQAAAAELPQPAWSLQVNATPTNFPPETEALRETGPNFHIVATNIGGEKTNGTFTITDELPDGMTVSEVETPYIQYGREGLNERQPCTFTAQVVTCVGGVGTTYAPATSNVNMLFWVHVEAEEGEALVNTVTIEGGGAGAVTKSVTTQITTAEPAFGPVSSSSGLFGTIANDDGTVATQAGSHPGDYEVVSLNTNHMVRPNAYTAFTVDGGLKDVRVDLPHGMVVNPQAVPECTETQLEVTFEEQENGLGCPDDSMVGTISIRFSFSGTFTEGALPLYNMVPPAGAPAEFGFSFIEGLYNHIKGFVRTGGDYGLSAIATDIPAKLPLAGIKVNLWGDPTSELHNELRGLCSNSFYSNQLCPPEERLETPFVSLPSSCEGSMTTNASIDSWGHPNDWVERSFISADPNENATQVSGCNQLEFDPSIESKATTNLADAPTGLDFKLHVPQASGIEAPSTANVKDVKVTLPEGMVVNPSAGDGLAGCSSAEIEIHGPNAATCPDAAKIGTAEIKTPLLGEPLNGAVYLAKPFDNQFNSLLALYIAVDDQRTGVVLKLPGEVQPNPATGQLVATFKENPELPFSDLNVSFFNGARAPLTSPASCGTKTTSATLTPWSTPEGADAIRSDSFTTNAAQGGGACPASDAGLPNELSFNAGTIAPKAGSFSPFVLRLTRPDGSQRITTIDTTLPPGLTGKLAGIPYCSEAQIGAAAARSHPTEGAAEQAAPSCPASTEVGSVDVGAGSGPTPLHVGGHAYLAGPYKGAPISLVVITPAVAGPFDLGNVVVRVALFVNPETAQIHAVSDPLPTILQGIPLDIRSVTLNMDRQGFTINPTSCDPMKVAASITSAAGQATALTSPFQVGACSALAFKPTLSLSLKGGTKRNDNPALTAIVTQPAGQANIGSVSVTLPHSAFLDQSHIRTVCTRVQFAEGNVPGEKCPPGSIYGRATAVTPLLADPISGPVYLRSSSHELPDLVAALHGQVDIVLDGRVDAVNGRLRNTFEAVPDAPVTKFVLKMQGGKKGLVVNSTNLCTATGKAALKWRGQNGKELESRPVVKNSCKKKRSRHKKSKR